MRKKSAPRAARAKAKQGAPRNRPSTGLHSKSKSGRVARPKFGG